MHDLEKHFATFRKNIIGDELCFETPYGKKKMIYADWIASGRLYAPIENHISNVLGPFVGNTHTETTESGTMMTKSYQYAHKKIKDHVHASENDVIITAGTGMTDVINKFQRILGMKTNQFFNKDHFEKIPEKPVVFITHMEHHSNHTSWLETYSDVVLLEPDAHNLVNPDSLRKEIGKYKNRKMKIGAFTACSNVTGVIPPYYELARIMHENDGYVFIDYAGSAPYVNMDMHPENPLERLDAVMFSPHKFLGGPGSSGVLIFNKDLYHNTVPDHPGGGTVDWTNPWGEYKYIDDIEIREDGGTPGFLQAIRAAMAINLKEEMDPFLMQQREHQLVHRAFEGFCDIPGLKIMAKDIRDRLGIFSFYMENNSIHYNLIVKLLNDRFGVQVRGGCACAGTYGHFLLGVTKEESQRIVEQISRGDLTNKPGFVRLSLHPTMTDDELETIIDAVKQIVANHQEWSKDYAYNPSNNEFFHKSYQKDYDKLLDDWFNISLGK